MHFVPEILFFMVDRKWNIEDDTSTPWACGFVGEALLQGNRLFGSYSDHAQGDEFIDSMTDEKPIKEPEIVLEGEELEALVNEARLTTTYDVMLPLSIGLAALWAFFIPFNLMELPEPSRDPVVIHDMFMVALSFALYLSVRTRWLPDRLVGPTVFFGAILIASNVILAYWMTERSFYTYYIGIILIASGNIILLTRWFLSSVFVILMMWATVAARFATPQEFINLIFLQVAAILVAVTIHLARVNFIRRITQLRHRDQVREKDLERALSQGERVRQELDQRVEERTRELQVAYDRLTDQMEERAQLEGQRRELESELHHAQRLESVGQLAGGVAHDFNNLLTVIGGNIDLVVRKSDALGDRQQVWLDEARKATQRAAELTSELLAYSRKQPVVFEPIDPVVVVGGVRKMIERAAGENVLLELDLNQTRGCILGGKGQIEQVVLNLVLNACDAMPLGGKLKIVLDEVAKFSGIGHENIGGGPYIRLRFIDNGIGMQSEVREKIFEPFFTTKETGKGTGLGLSVVHGIVSQHGGFVDVKSSPSAGTTVSVYLPSVMEEAVVESAEVATSVENPASGETILVVEDEEAVRQFTETLLEEMGYRVLVAENGEHALHVSKEYAGQIDLLLTDVVMPGIQGPQLARELLVTRPGMPILYVSGYTDPQILADLHLEERMSFLQKPFTREALQEKIRDLRIADSSSQEAMQPESV